MASRILAGDHNSIRGEATVLAKWPLCTDKISTTLGDARALKWNAMKKKSTVRLPPDKDSHDLKMARVNYQTYVWLNYDQADGPPLPYDHGWIRHNGACMPLRYNKPALPRDFEELQRYQSLPQDDDDDSSDSECESDCSDD